MRNLFSAISLIFALPLMLLTSCDDKNGDDTPPPAKAEFTIEVEGMTANSATTKVTPPTPQMYYVMYLCDMSYLVDNNIDTAEALFADDMMYFKNGADYDGSTLLEYMQKNKVVFQGTSRVKWPNVFVGTTSVLYVYGIEFNEDYTDCTLITDIAYEILEPEPAELQDVKFSAGVAVKGAEISVEVTPESWNGNYYIQIFDDEHDLYYDENEEVTLDYAEQLSAKWIEMYRANLSSGFAPADIIEALCYKGTQTVEYELMSDDSYTLVIYAVEEVDGVYQMVSMPYVKNFTTNAVSASDMTIDIDIENCYVRVCDLKITPSKEDESYIMLFTPTEYLPKKYSDDDLVDIVLGDFYDFTYTFKGSISSHMTTLYPSKEYIVVAFGFSGGVVTTPVFKEVFTTMPEGECELTIEDVRYGGPYKISEVAALMPEEFDDVIGMPDDSYYLMWSEIITSKPTDELFTYVVDEYTFEEFGEDIIFFDLLFQVREPVVYDICMYEYGYYICSAAFDYKGDVTPMWRSEVIHWSIDDLRPASEFVEKLESSPKARPVLVRAKR